MGTAEGIEYASISPWEWGCCGEVPVPGARIDGILTAQPVSAPDRFVVSQPFSWVRELELLRFADYSAHWNPADGDPTAQPIGLSVSWHDDAAATYPSVTGSVIQTYEITYGADVPGAPRDTTPKTYRRVDVVERYMDMDREPYGLLVGFVPDSCTEPTTAEIANYQAKIERASRAISLNGPATAFGDVVPARGDVLRIDLADPRVGLSRNRFGVAGVVSGVIEQVGMFIPDASGLWSIVASVPAGTPADTLDRELFVTLVVDRAPLSR
ncbi:hypothetical protein [Gordonia sp. MP11Mi]|uniref:Uncharacterized protein n=1 Tax=Gordonia sp. MP11Mi TaxID=3022769 RepID=A0AA97CYL2_9ACTN